MKLVATIHSKNLNLRSLVLRLTKEGFEELGEKP